ncbi:MAG TPA: type II CAAX endopeptidase family protein [Candidatus Limnocylindria bacterium]|nr:type II CAAX endopeptidase family protein [Candidatus Limnocylindria bacterium]
MQRERQGHSGNAHVPARSGMLRAVPTVIDHILFLVLALLFPVRAGLFGYRRLRLAPEPEIPVVRMALYREAILLQWTLAALVFAFWLQQGRPIGGLGLTAWPNWGLAVALVGVATAIVIVLRQRSQILASDEALARVRNQVAHVERLLPRSVEELQWFYRVSITAGICEEVLYRGYVIWYLGQWMGPLAAMVGSAVVFGCGHVYQGPRGMLATGAVGLVLGVLYLATGTIYVGMVVHALIDMHSGHLAREAYTRELELASA